MNTHNATVTRNTPTALIFLLDISGSMSENIEFEGEKITKNNALNKIVNSILNELILRCKSYNNYNNYFDIAVLGYQDDSVINLLEQYTNKEGFCSVNDIVTSDIDFKVYNYIRTKSDGSKFISQVEITQYIDTEPHGTTPMLKALDAAFQLLKKWTVEHNGKNCFPPVLFNITDGDTSDATPQEMIIESNKIKRLTTDNGNVLFMNIHLSSQMGENPIIFPNSESELPNVRNIKLMYEMSSRIPKSFQERLKLIKKDGSETDYLNGKLMCYNTPIDALAGILEIGSMSKSFIK